MNPLHWLYGVITAMLIVFTAVFSPEIREGLMVLVAIGLFGLLASLGVKFVAFCDQAKQDIFAAYHDSTD